MTVVLFSLTTMESFENGLQPYSGATPLFSMRTELLVSLQSCCSIDADAWFKQALTSDTECENMKSSLLPLDVKRHMKSQEERIYLLLKSLLHGVDETIHFPCRHNSYLRATRDNVVKCSHMGVKLNARTYNCRWRGLFVGTSRLLSTFCRGYVTSADVIQ